MKKFRLCLSPIANAVKLFLTIDPGRSFAAGGSNFYLAMFNRPGGGKVWYWNCGHLDYAHDVLLITSTSERNLIVEAMA